MGTQQIVYWGVLIAIFFLVRRAVFRGTTKVPTLQAYMFTGTMGSGKTFLSAETAKRLIKQRRLKHVLSRLFPRLATLFFPDALEEPLIYSTYPIVKYWEARPFKEWLGLLKERYKALFAFLKLSHKDRKELRLQGYRLPSAKRKYPVFYPPLKLEHVLGAEKCPEGSIWVIGECGRIFPQWDFNNPIVVEQAATIFALSRHFFNAVLIFDDQCSDNLVKAIRCRLGMIYHLHDFRRILGFLPWYKVDFVPLLPVEDTASVVERDEDEAVSFRGFLPYRWMYWRKNYESRCYRPLYCEAAQSKVDEFDSFYTRYLPDISVSDSLVKLYRTNKRGYKRMFLYGKEWDYDFDTGEFTLSSDVAEGGEAR